MMTSPNLTSNAGFLENDTQVNLLQVGQGRFSAIMLCCFGDSCHLGRRRVRPKWVPTETA